MADINPALIACVEVFPPIGIARVGNSEEYFLGPEVPGRFDTPAGGFKDANLKVKRQAARFRAYAFNKNGEVLGELTTAAGYDLEWTVEVANKKPSYYTFMGRTQPGAFQPGNTTLRNPTVQPTLEPDARNKCIIAPGAKTIQSNSTATVDMRGEFWGSNPSPVSVYLGSALVDESGRLVFVPGHGKSYCTTDPKDPYPLILTDFDNPNWVDDTCDGTVNVRVSKGGKSWKTTNYAHVVGTTPKFASAIYAPTTIFDVIENIYAKAKNGGDVSKAVGDIEYWRDIWTLIERPALLSWVNGQANGGHGPARKGNFFDPEWQKKLHSTSPEDEATRKIVLGRMRLPDIDTTQASRSGQAFPYFMPWLSGDGGRTTAGDETTFSSITELQYARLSQWADGHFHVDSQNIPNPPTTLEKIPLALQPEALTRANLEWTIGSPLYPGIELSWNAELPETYDLSSEALSRGVLGWRINKSVKPGDLTRFLSLPWQSDFYMCRNYWWPSARPDAILREQTLEEVVKKYGWAKVMASVSTSTTKDHEAAAELNKHVPWERGLHQNYTDVYADQPLFANTDMARNWHKLGFIVKAKTVSPIGTLPQLPIFIETQRQNPHPELSIDAAALASFEEHAHARSLELTMPRPERPFANENSPIHTLASLKQHLHFAMAVELSTIPLYLYAMYSIKLPAAAANDPRYFDPVTDALRGIIAEEMLHLSLAGNVLKAVGGTPKLYELKFQDIKVFPTYPMKMPGRVPTLYMNLRPAKKENFDTFLGIELPAGRDAPPEADEYQTLGQFYLALQLGLKYLAEREGEDNLFQKDSIPFQFAPGTGYQPRVKNAGGSVVVHDLKSAVRALEIIIEEGEGSNGTEYIGDERAHYYIFKDLQEGKQEWDVYNVPENPITEDYLNESKQIYEVSRTFDAAYCYLLLTIEKLWTVNDEENRRNLVLANMYSLMLGVLAPLARFLVAQELAPGRNAAPCFSWFKFYHETDLQATPFEQLRAQMKLALLSYVDVTGEDPDQVVEHNFGAQIDALIPIQSALDNLLDISTFERPKTTISKRGLAGQTSGSKGFA